MKFKEMTLGKKVAIGAIAVFFGSAVLAGASDAILGTNFGEDASQAVEKTAEASNPEVTPEAKEDVKKEAKKETENENLKVEKGLTAKYIQSKLTNNDLKDLEIINENGILNINLEAVNNITTDMMVRSNCMNLVDILKLLKDEQLLTDDLEVVKVNFFGEMTNGEKKAWIGTMYDVSTVNELDYESIMTQDILKHTSGGTVGMNPSIREDLKADGDFSFLK